jgi:carboxyl-terminal processing protease
MLPDQFSHLESGEKFLDYSIPWGEVKAVSYDRLMSYDLKKLRSLSESRVKNNKKFRHILDSIKWFKNQKEKTNRSLVARDFETERKNIREMADSFKKEEENKNLVVKDTSVKAGDKAQAEKFEDFSKTLKKDAVIEESMLIMNDMLTAQKL